MEKVITFGEIMLRLSTPGRLRFRQATAFDATFGGGEANVAAALANFGIPASFVTALPENDIGRACEAYLLSFGINTGSIVFKPGRLGIYYIETGSGQRGSNVVYDRSDSAFASLPAGALNWEQILTGAKWFHFTGITPAVSEGAYLACLEGIKAAKKMGLTVSCDLNYRAKLWKWGKKAGGVMPDLVSLCDLVVGNEEDAEKIFGIKAPGADITAGKVSAKDYEFVARELVKKFPNIKNVAITLRGSISADHNSWSGVLYDGQELYCGKTYQITDIVDRVGGGDSFAAGLIYGFLKYGGGAKALEFALAASCLKHSIQGDFNIASVGEVEKLLKGDSSGRVSR